MTRPSLGYVFQHHINFPPPLLPFIHNNTSPRENSVPEGTTPKPIHFSLTISASDLRLVLMGARDSGICTYGGQWISTVSANGCPARASTATPATAIRPTTAAITTAITTTATPPSTGTYTVSGQRWTPHGQFERQRLRADRGSFARDR
jgi:hypothetical protein